VLSELPTSQLPSSWADYSEPLDEHLICLSTLLQVGSDRPIGLLPSACIAHPFVLATGPSEPCPHSHRLLKYPFEMMEIADGDTCSIQRSRYMCLKREVRVAATMTLLLAR
jgi:hypothetical protein